MVGSFPWSPCHCTDGAAVGHLVTNMHHVVVIQYCLPLLGDHVFPLLGLSTNITVTGIIRVGTNVEILFPYLAFAPLGAYDEA